MEAARQWILMPAAEESHLLKIGDNLIKYKINDGSDRSVIDFFIH